MSRRDVLIDCESLAAPLTGIGRYTFNLLDALSRGSGIGQVRCFDGHCLVPPEVVLQQERSTSAQSPSPIARMAGSLKRVMRNHQVAYEVRGLLRNRKFRKAAKGLEDSVYHQPAFVMAPFQGRTVTTVHDLSFVRFPEAHPAGRAAFLTRHLPETLERADRIITPSGFTRDELLSLFAVDARKVVVTPLGVASCFQPRGPEECRTALAQHGLEYRGFLLFVGTLEPRKNLALLMDAWVSLPDQVRRRYPLVIAGGRGWGDDPLLERIKMLERHMPLRYLDYVPAAALSVLYSAAAMVVYPSAYEGFGLPVLESMASGTPVICCSGTAMAEYAGDAGFLAESADASALKDAILMVLEDVERVSMHVRRGLEVASRHTWSACAEMTLRVYRSID